MNISRKMTVKQLEEILINVKEQENNDIDVIDLVNLIQQDILTKCSTS